MPNYSVLFAFDQGTYGWTEKYFTQESDGGVAAVYPKAIQLFKKRMLLSGAETEAQYIRISQEGVQGDSYLQGIVPGTIPATLTVQSDAPTTCLLLRLRDVTNQYQKNVFIRGIWDQNVVLGGKYQPSDAYRALVNSFVAELKSGRWGWMASDRNAVTIRNIASITQEAGGTIKVTTSNGSWVGMEGQSVNVRMSRVVGSSNLNGPLVLVPDSANIAYSLRRIAILPVTANTGRIRYSTPLLKLVDSGDITRVGERRTGRPILQPRGRSRARPRG